MPDASFFRRLGGGALAAALGLLALDAYMGRAASTATEGMPPLARVLFTVGGISLGLALLLDAIAWLGGRVGKRCPRCGRAAARGSVFCSAHRQELAQAARQARSHHRE